MKQTAQRKKRTPEDFAARETRSFEIRFPRRPQAVILFPGPYSAAIANLGYLTVWERLNSIEGFTCDRAVWNAAARTEPRGLETRLPLSAFPLIFVSSSFELDLENVIRVLSVSGIDPVAARRERNAPLIIAGGISLTLNPAPWAAVLDLAILGEGEEASVRWVKAFQDWQERGLSRPEIIEASSSFPFVWIPSLPGRSVTPAKYDSYAEDPTASSTIHPWGHFGRCWLVEVTRGCPRRCMFCAVCGAYSARFADAEAVLLKLEQGRRLGANKVGLVGAAVGDHPRLKDLISRITEEGHEVTLSSLRIERADEELLQLLSAGGLKTLTVAPEAGDENLRRQLGKKATDDELVQLVKRAGCHGLHKLRLYFLIGLPQREPADKIISLVARLRKEAPADLKLDLSISSFIPKPGTPWELEAFAPVGDLDKAKRKLRSELRRLSGVTVHFEPTRQERRAALLSRGDEKLGEALLRAVQVGRPLEQELRLSGVDIEELLSRAPKPENLPWKFITPHE